MFVADMETVLALDAEPSDPARPVVCFDERPWVLRSDVREPLAMRPGSERKRVHEYIRGGRAACWPPSSRCGRGGTCGRSPSVGAWTRRNAVGGTVAWQMTTGDARVKLARLYPSATT